MEERLFTDKNKVFAKEFTDDVVKIVDDKSLLEFCVSKNKWRQADKKNRITKEQKETLFIQIAKNVFSQNKKISVETCVELSKLLSKDCSRFDFERLEDKFDSCFEGNNDSVLQDLSGDFELCKYLSIYNTQTEKIENMEEVFAFIKKHKDTKNTPENVKDYLNLILYVLELDYFDNASCHVADFFALKLVDFSNPTSYDKLFFCNLYNLLLLYLEKDKNNQQATIETLKNILNNTPGTILALSYTMKILGAFRENHVNFSMDSVMIKKLFSECNFKDSVSVDDLITIWSCCENNSLSGEIMDKMLDGLCEYHKFLKESGVGQCRSERIWATPSLISFIKQKLTLNENYSLEQKLKDKFTYDIAADHISLIAFFWRCCAEVSARISHRKEDVVEMLKDNVGYEIDHVYNESKKKKVKEQLLFAFRERCGYAITDKYEKAGIFDKTYREFDGFVKTIFEEKWLIATEINKNNQPNGCLTIQEIRAIVLSNFKFGDYGVTKEKFQSVIMDRIDKVEHFEWLLQVHIEQDAPIETSDLCCYVKYLKIDSLWLLNEYLSIIAKNMNNKISKTVLSVLLDVYDGNELLLFDKEHDPYGDNKSRFNRLNNLVCGFKDQCLINKFDEKFKPTVGNVGEPHIEIREDAEQEVKMAPATIPLAGTANNLQNHQMNIRDKNKSVNKNENEEKENEKGKENRNSEESKNQEGHQCEKTNLQAGNGERFENKECEPQQQKDVNAKIQKDTNSEESKTSIWLLILYKIAYFFWFIFTLGSPIWAPSLTEKLFSDPKIPKLDQNNVDKSILPGTSEVNGDVNQDIKLENEDGDKNRNVK